MDDCRSGSHLANARWPLATALLACCTPCLAGLAEVEAVLQDKALAQAQCSVLIVRLGASPAQDQPLFAHEADVARIPASNLKLVTTAAALHRLGPEFQFRTALLLRDGDLVVWGDGDPSLGDAEALKRVGWDVTTVLRSWAEQLRRRNVTTVRNVVVDDSIFDQQFVHPRWPADQEHKRYVAQVGGLNLNANCVDVLVRPTEAGQPVRYALNPTTGYLSLHNACVSGGRDAVWLTRQPGGNQVVLRGQAANALDVPVSVTVHDPPLYAGTVLAETLAAAGIRVTGSILRDRTTRQAYTAHHGGWSVVAVHQTPLAAVLARANKDSMNLYAECLTKRLGHQAAGQPGSWESGTAAAAAFLRDLGIDQAHFRLDDGSGLSKSNAISATAITRVLSAMFHGRHREPYMASLAVAGTDGTLQERFRATDLRGRILGKSGFVASVSALSGYLKGRDGQWHAFSILMNGIPDGSNATMKQLQERIVRAVDAGRRE